jgi:hypothetical protein
MNWLRKVENRRTPPGAEVRILKALPRITFVGTLLALAFPVLTRLFINDARVDASKHIKSADIFAIAAEVSLLIAVVTVAIGCVVVYIMKGPAYGADSLPVEHSDRPRQDKPEQE